MELFEESKNRYFSLITEILNLSVSGLEENKIIQIINDGEYEEKVIGKNQQSFEGLILNQYDNTDNFNLLEKKEDKYYSVGGKVPIRFTKVEKIWIREMLKDSNCRELLGEELAIKLDKELNINEEIDISSIIERTNLEDKYESKFPIENFNILLEAIRDDKEIIYDNKDYKNERAVPLKIEYDIRSDVLRTSMYYIDEERLVLVNLSSMSNIKVTNDKKCKLEKDEIYKQLRENKRCKEPIVFQVKDKRQAMERCFMTFSSFERTSKIIKDNVYEITLYYYTFQEEEIIRKILSLGSYITVLEPTNIKEKIIKRVKKAIEREVK
ncbi:hypothetical protein CM240_3071 [Clostridium bornimense]|uniref:Uncharacterized protein n=1 Tax=Clostridium bornimense TaxID=1216932 RepID=W6S0C0_9CLOT|nr:WYL domain-containing protein [Clostridium bornimense]CDM70188.1 hypothetical protein CM240_3071 [Clostridium bornimense]